MYHERPINAHPRHDTGALAHVLMSSSGAETVEAFPALIDRHPLDARS